jgi:hypothetical protein
MVLYECYNCGYISKNKNSMISHLNRKNICKSIRNHIDLELYKEYILQGISYNQFVLNYLLKNNPSSNIFHCEYCKTNHKCTKSLSKHKNICNMNPINNQEFLAMHKERVHKEFELMFQEINQTCINRFKNKQ